MGSENGFAIVTRLVEEGLVDLLSVMDHTPGQGQFKSMASYVGYLTSEHQVPEHQIIEKIHLIQTLASGPVNFPSPWKQPERPVIWD